MSGKDELIQEMRNFVIRVLKGNCTPQETAILPAVLQMIQPQWEI